MYRIFVSYSFHDQATADRFWALRRPPHVGVYVAQRSLPFGGQIPNEIAEAIRQCDLFVLLWSGHAQGSEWVNHELGMARALGKSIIPVLLDPGCKPPDPIRDLKYMQYYENPDSWMGWFHQLVNDVVTRAGPKKEPAFDWRVAGAGLLAGLGLAWLMSKGDDDDE